MMNKAVVVVGALIAAGAGYASAEFLDKGPKPVRRHVRGGRGGELVVRLPAGAPVDPTTVGAGTTKPGAGAAKPAAGAAATAKPVPETPKPAVPEIKLRERVVKDVRLVAVANSKEYRLRTPCEVHVDIENTMTWFGGEGKTTVYRDLKHLGTHVRDMNSPSLVIVPAPEVPWQQIAMIIEAAQNNYVTDVYLGVAAAEAPEMLRLLSIPQTQRSDDPLPEGKRFEVVLEKKDGDPQVSVDGKKIEKLPEDLAAAWNEWRKANADAAKAESPDDTRVIFSAPRGAAAAQIIRVIDIFRGLGIHAERYTVAAPMRKLK